MKVYRKITRHLPKRAPADVRLAQVLVARRADDQPLDLRLDPVRRGVLHVLVLRPTARPRRVTREVPAGRARGGGGCGSVPAREFVRHPTHHAHRAVVVVKI